MRGERLFELRSEESIQKQSAGKIENGSHDNDDRQRRRGGPEYSCALSLAPRWGRTEVVS